MPELLPPLVVAPMAGGPSNPALVTAAARAGSVGFLAAGYQSPEAVEHEVRAVRAAGVPYGLNIFVPAPAEPDPAPVGAYRRLLLPEAERYGVDLPPPRLHDDDHFAAKVDVAVAYAVPLVSFAFGVPPAGVVRALRDAGCYVLITVTSADEGRRAVAAGPDALVAQAGTAGGHASTTDPAGYRPRGEARDLLAAVRAVTDLPVVVAGGTSSFEDVARLRAAGAAAVQSGTAFLLADEAGTRPAQRAAMLSGDFRRTVVTRAFTGHPARALRNRFTDVYSEAAPVAYPAVHHLTAPIRAAAARLGDAEALNLWAGTGFASAAPGPAVDIVARLTG
ncbi:nitronate monooxygenase [Micromonospora sp. C32]|uniref:NAD(P)H-dependent flavin oxidoreductase n=1 Tax=unclassified Micromonospora TaxID=2617518 RepID=UPI001B369ABD|nr:MULTISPECIES: nitronate monooxygenase [unclassified Micromonospora]MBQ1041640.1 nitronate monooxygenase [Micromonospora sp. C72]MBQ1053315.1 nitronate monooxygenase [Micromonospora sp. C32]